MQLTKELAVKMASKINLREWKILQDIDRCFICKSVKEPLYVPLEGGDGEKVLNGKYLFHLFSTHALHPNDMVNMIADRLYKNDEDKEKMRALYKFYETL